MNFTSEICWQISAGALFNIHCTMRVVSCAITIFWYVSASLNTLCSSRQSSALFSVDLLKCKQICQYRKIRRENVSLKHTILISHKVVLLPEFCQIQFWLVFASNVIPFSLVWICSNLFFQLVPVAIDPQSWQIYWEPIFGISLGIYLVASEICHLAFQIYFLKRRKDQINICSKNIGNDCG